MTEPTTTLPPDPTELDDADLEEVAGGYRHPSTIQNFRSPFADADDQPG